MGVSFVHLNVHSNFSLLAGTRTVHELVASARLAGMRALALTDTNGLYAAVEFQMACRAADIRPVFGAELRHAGKRAVVLARDAEGYAEVCRLVTRRHLDEKFVLGDALESTSEHVFVLCHEPVILRRLRGRLHVYVELVCHHDVESRRCKYHLLDVADRLGLPVVATNNVHFLGSDEITTHRVLCAIRTNRTVGTLPPGEVEHEECYLRSPGEMATLFDDVPEALEQSVHIAWSCRYEIPLGRPRPPRFRFPKDATESHSVHRPNRRPARRSRLSENDEHRSLATPRLGVTRADHRRSGGNFVYTSVRRESDVTLRTDSCDGDSPASGTAAAGATNDWAGATNDPATGTNCPVTVADRNRAFQFLRQLCQDGLVARLPNDGGPSRKTGQAPAVLERELDVIRKLDLAEYFLVCWDLVRFARSRGMPCLGRGSAANSLVSYCLYITHVNPLEHNLFFERFLNLERESYPDFDIDFGTDDREVVLDYVFERYGQDRVAMICTYSTMHVRSAVREVAKALGVGSGEIDAVVKRLPHSASARDVRERVAGDPARRGLPLDREPFRTILEIASRIGEFPRHLATHPCGLVIAPEPITHIVPLERGDKGLEITQWDMNAVEDAGLVKIDILGQKGLAVIGDTIRQVEQNENRLIDPEATDPLHDEAGRALLRTGRTVGCFYIESPIMLQLLEQARCDDFEVLTALSSIIRPGVSNYGGKKQYLLRHLGLQKPEVLHPRLEPVLRDTYGCLIYQEQVIQVAQAVASMTLTEADGLRKCMSKKRHWQRMETYRERFLTGARQNDVPEPVALEIYRQIESFAGYAFCKAHSASFALESFESAYWKARYPAEFMAAVLTNQGGYYTTLEYAEEARRLGLRLLAPCVNASQREFWGKGNELRVGLMQVKGLSQKSIDSILDARGTGGPYRDLGDFLQRARFDRAEAVLLVRCGAFDFLGETRPRLLWELALRLSATDSKTRVEALVGQIPAFPDYDASTRRRAELEILEMTLDAHPFALFASVLERVRRLRPVVSSTSLRQQDGGQVYLLGWKVTSKRTTTTDGKAMCFVTFSDEQGRFEASFFPEVYERCAVELVRGPGPFLVKGRVETHFGVSELVASHVKLLSVRQPDPGSEGRHVGARR